MKDASLCQQTVPVHATAVVRMVCPLPLDPTSSDVRPRFRWTIPRPAVVNRRMAVVRTEQLRRTDLTFPAVLNLLNAEVIIIQNNWVISF